MEQFPFGMELKLLGIRRKRASIVKIMTRARGV